MSDPLRIGIAGLGTVGTGVLDAFARHGELLAARCGRSVKVTAVSARTRSKARGHHDISGFAWYDDAADMAANGDIDVLVELIGGEEGAARACVEAALKAGDAGSAPVAEDAAIPEAAPAPTPISDGSSKKRVWLIVGVVFVVGALALTLLK